MKKNINMKKVIVAATIFTIVLFVFPLSSFAEGDSYSCTIYNTGNIEGLVFKFDDSFELELDGFVATITGVEVIGSGQELSVVTLLTSEESDSANYIYNATLTGGWNGSKKGKGKNNGKIITAADLYTIHGFLIEEDVSLHFEFDSASLFEQFGIVTSDEIDAACAGEDVDVPKEANLFFEVIKTKLIGITWFDGTYQKNKSDSFNFILILEDGDVDVSQTF